MDPPDGMTREHVALIAQNMPSLIRIVQSLSRGGIPKTDTLVMVADIRSRLGLAYGRFRWRYGELVRRVAKQVVQGKRPVIMLPLWGQVRARFVMSMLDGEDGFINGCLHDHVVLLVVDRDSHWLLTYFPSRNLLIRRSDGHSYGGGRLE